MIPTIAQRQLDAGLTPRWYPLRYHEPQCRAWRSRCRFVGLAAGRGSGKTEIARRRVIRYLPVKKNWERPLYFYAMPTYKQARRVAWQELLDLVPQKWLARPPNNSEMMIETVFGSQLFVVGLDKPQRIEGSQWDGGVIDESCDIKAGTFTLSVMPALTHRQGWCWRIGVPKRVGPGAAEFKRWCGATPGGEGPVAEEYYTWPSRDILTPEELKFARENFAATDFAEQFEASWESVGGLIFYAFDAVKNVSDQVAYRPDLPIIVGSDFNVDPMAWVIMQERVDVKSISAHDRKVLCVFDEIFLRNTNTRLALDELHKRYGSHRAGFDFHGDAAGRARKTSASESDYQQIKGDKRFAAARVWYPKANPARHDRFAACNAMFCNADQQRRVFVHPRCKQLIRDLTSRAYEQGSNEPDDYGDVGHITDALGYPIHRKYPLRAPNELMAPKILVLGEQ